MTDDRWQRVKALFQAVVERPAGEREAFLAAAAGDDEALRREVESLLASDAADVSLLAQMRVDGSAGLDEVPTMVRASMDKTDSPLTGARQIGPYEVIGLIGLGAMGEVYRARDTNLNRDVALKVLPPLFAFDPDRLARFRREAQLLAALNHPNIAAIYGFEDAGGVHALVLELVEGPTLADRIALGPLNVAEALAIGSQIAEAIEAAHEKGIIHRDLKPANIKINRGGTVKVLDFGLAKAATPDSTSPDITASHEGLILGTAAYMSPEQARGQTVDKRTDVWAFGCVLYEMLTGRFAFPGGTISDTIARILEREPDWSALPETTPVAIRRALLRCLVKDPKQRMRDIGDVRIEMGAIDAMLPGVDPRTIVSIPGKSRSNWLAGAALAALVILVVAWQMERMSRPTETPLAGARFLPLTNWDGTEEGAEISPDGRFIAFLSDHDGEFDIWMIQIGTGHFTNLTRDFPPLSPLGSIVRKLGFNGDGAEIWFNPASRQPLLLMPLTGGMPRAFLGEGNNTPAWSPSGDRLVYFGKPADGDDPMFIADATGANPRQLLAQRGHSNNPVWSPDGQWIYYVNGADPQDEMDINVWRVRAAGGSPQQLTNQHEGINFLAPLGNDTLLYVSRAEDGSGPWLWALDIPSKATRRVPSGVSQYTSVAASRDGRRIVATVANPSGSLWRAPLLERLAEDRDARPYALPMPTGLAFAPRFSGTSLFYLSARGTSNGLWKVTDERASQVWRDVDGPLVEPAALSRDGRGLAVIVRQKGKRHISIMSPDGTNRRTLAASLEIQGAIGQSAVDWSPDGKWIVAGGRDAAGDALFKIPVDGGEPQRLVEGKWGNPIWSSDGKLIVYAGRSVVGQVDLQGVRPDGVAVDMPQVRVRPGGYRFLPDGTGLVYLPDIHVRDFWLLDLATGKTRQLTRLSNQGTIRTFDITPDGRYVVFDRSRQNANIVLIDVPTQ